MMVIEVLVGAIGFDTKEHIIQESDFVKLYRKDDEIYAVVFYAKKNGTQIKIQLS